MSILYEKTNYNPLVIIRVAVYIRFSSHKQADSYSVEYQKEECMKYIENRGYKFVCYYIDEAKTAKKTAGRDALEKMLSDAGKNKFDKIIVYSFSRSFRNTRDALNTNFDLMENYGIVIESVIEPVDMTSPHGKFSATNLFSMHELQSNITAAHVKSGMNMAAIQGYYLGGYVPYGYDLYETGEFTRGKPRKKYIINEKEAENVREMFRLYAENFSLNFIQQAMKERGVIGRKGKVISFQTICRILRNVFYIGIRKYEIKGYEKIYLPETVPIIIDMQTWQTVQQRHREYKEAMPVKPRKTKRLYALTGKLVCAKCGAHLTGTYKGNKRNEKWSYSYYHCTNKKGRNTCDLLNIRKDFVETFCLNEIKSKILNPESIQNIAAFILSKATETPQDIKAEQSKLTRRKNQLMENIQAARKKEIEAKEEKDEIEMQISQNIISDYKQEVKQINEKLDALANMSEAEITHDSIEQYLNHLLNSAESTDENVIKSLFDKLIEKLLFMTIKLLFILSSIFMPNMGITYRMGNRSLV